MIRKHTIINNSKSEEDKSNITNITTQHKMKYKKNVKQTLNTKKHITKHIHKNKKKLHFKLKHKNYISTLINLYYDNDNVVNNFLDYKNIKAEIKRL